VDAVTAVYNDNTQKSFAPFYGIKHNQEQNQFWYLSRRAATPREGVTDHGTELFVSLVDIAFKPSSETQYALDIETLCCNRDLPHQLPFGGDQPYFQFSEFSAPVQKIECLVRPTQTYRNATGKAVYWRLISQLSLNKISLSDPQESSLALKELLRLYNFTDSNETRAIIDSVLSLSTKPIIARDPNGHLSFCQGTEIIVELDPDRLTGSSLFLFASVLEEFFALYCTINSFTKLTILDKGKHRILHTWPPRTGEQTLL
jgi:type VI secretion system protein ImpG